MKRAKGVDWQRFTNNELRKMSEKDSFGNGCRAFSEMARREEAATALLRAAHGMATGDFQERGVDGGNWAADAGKLLNCRG